MKLPRFPDISLRFASTTAGAISPHRRKSANQQSLARDISAGSNTTGNTAKELNRRWMTFEKDHTYLAASAFSFVAELPTEDFATLLSQLHLEDLPVRIDRQRQDIVLREMPVRYAVKTP